MRPTIVLMRCYYCGVAIIPPDGYRDEDPCCAELQSMEPQGMEPQGMELQGMEPQGMELQGMEPQGVEVCFRAGGVGAGRVEYVLVICPSCHHVLRSVGWFPPEYQAAGDGAWVPLLPTAPARQPSRMDGGSAAYGHARSSAVHSGPRLAWDKPLHVPSLRPVPRADHLGISNRRNDGVSARRWRWKELAMLALCLAAFAGAVAGAILYLS